ncbi:hypothetical protein NPS74_23930, partial [Cutibacterium acnes subsp. acnes]|nr:hypothetical protein [Cutibacterium acnes subsp. acnes]
VAGSEEGGDRDQGDDRADRHADHHDADPEGADPGEATDDRDEHAEQQEHRRPRHPALGPAAAGQAVSGEVARPRVDPLDPF